MKGGVAELQALLTDSLIGYGLVRVTTNVDQNEVTRYCLIVYVGNSVGGLRKVKKREGEKISKNLTLFVKGKIVTHKGDILDFIGQYHTDLSATQADEVTPEIVQDLVV